MKYKRAKKQRSVLMVSCITIILLICMGTGYALFEGSLTMKGYAIFLKNASQRPIVEVNDTVSLVSKDPSNLIGFTLNDGSVTVQSQYITENEIHIEYKINTNTGTPRNEIINFEIQNTSDFSMTGGTFSYTTSGTNAGSIVNGIVTATFPSIIHAKAIRFSRNLNTFKTQQSRNN